MNEHFYGLAGEQGYFPLKFLKITRCLSHGVLLLLRLFLVSLLFNFLLIVFNDIFFSDSPREVKNTTHPMWIFFNFGKQRRQNIDAFHRIHWVRPNVIKVVEIIFSDCEIDNLKRQ